MTGLDALTATTQAVPIVTEAAPWEQPQPPDPIGKGTESTGSLLPHGNCGEQHRGTALTPSALQWGCEGEGQSQAPAQLPQWGPQSL